MARKTERSNGRLRQRRQQGLRCGLWIIGIVSAIGVLFVAGEYVQRLVIYRQARANPDAEAVYQSGAGRPPELIEPVRHMIANAYHSFPRPWEEAKLEEFDYLPVYELQIDPDDREELRHIAEAVQAAEFSAGIERPYVNAKFRLDDGRWMDIEVKLRGTTSQHYLRERPSLRLKFPKNHPLNGRRQINLCHADDKLLTQDVTTNWELSRYGILTWHSDFVVLKINGEVLGIFQELEQFGRSMTDPALRTEGFIASGTGQLFGANGEDDADTEVDGFGWDKAVPALTRLLACRDQGWVAPDMKPCDWEFVQQYMDTDRFAWAAAMTTLLASEHAWTGDNFRAYYDPARGKFGPIPWDYLSFYIDPARRPDGETARYQEAAFLRLPEFRRMRDERLWTLITERVEPMIEHARELFARLKEPLRYMPRNPASVWDEDDHRYNVEDKLRKNAEFLRSLYEKHDLRASGSWTSGGRYAVELENHGKAAVAVNEVVLRDGAETIKVALKTPHFVDSVWLRKPGRSTVWLRREAVSAVTIPKNAALAGLSATNAVTGRPFAESDINTGVQLDLSSPAPPAPKAPPAVKTPPNVRLAENRLIFGPGPVRLDSTLEVPKEYLVEFRPGLRLTLAEGASLIIYGDLESVGRVDNPITVSGVDSTLNWGSLVIQGTRVDPSKVHIEYTTLTGGTGAQNNRTHFTAAFAVTDGVVTVHNSRFMNLNSEDGINLRYCEVDFQNNFVHRTPDDMIDLDFCHGVASGNLIEYGGGDGLDMSGSRMLLEQNHIRYCLDKGFSVGEGTIAEIRDNLIYDCRTGVASKDGSLAKIFDNGMARLEVGIALYRKKLTFGEPAAEVEGLALSDVESAFLVHPETHLKVSSAVRYVTEGAQAIKAKGYEQLNVRSKPSNADLEDLLFVNSAGLGIRNAAKLPQAQ